MLSEDEVIDLAKAVFLKNKWGDFEGAWGPYQIGTAEIWEVWSFKEKNYGIRPLLTKKNGDKLWFADFGKFCNYINNDYINPDELPLHVFLSYRRRDTADVVGRINESLSRILSEGNVFRDIDKIPPGGDIQKYIDQSISQSDVLLAVIGPQWIDLLRANDPFNDSANIDYVGLEIDSALRQNIHIIPVLVGNATMPTETELPDKLKKLSNILGIPVRPDPDFNHDIDRLVKGIKEVPRTRIKRPIFAGRF